MTSPYRSMLKIRVTLMLRPSLIIWRMAGIPSSVAGILTSTLGRSMRLCRYRAASMVPAVSWARDGATSTETKPSAPWAESNTGRRMPRAASTSWMTRSQ